MQDYHNPKLLAFEHRFLFPLCISNIAILCATSENSSLIAVHLTVETIYHVVISHLVNEFGMESRSAIVLNIIRNIVTAINAGIIQRRAGATAPLWIWQLGGLVALATSYNVLVQPVWVSIISTIKVVKCFVLLYYFGDKTLSDALTTTYGMAVLALVINFGVYSVRKKEQALHRTHAKLREQYEKYKSLIDSISDVVIIVNRKFEIEFMKNNYCNTPACDYYKASVFELFGEEKQKKKMKQYLEEVFRTGKSTSWEWECVAKYFRATASAIKKHNNVVAVTVLISDVTARENARKQKLEVEKAELRLKAKSEFISLISHELRNPLQAISYAIDLLSETKLQRFQTEIVENIITSTRLLSSIIGKVLDMTKIESGKMELEEKSMSILATVESVAEIFSSLAFKKGLELISYVDLSLPSKCIGDDTRVSQILNNFVSNAIKFTMEGHIFITAEKESQSESETVVVFKCIDTGIGISKEKQQVLFKRFVQVHERPEFPTSFGGWGLGLAISKQLSDMMGGQIGVTSELGVGSTFWFRVPFKHKEGTCSILSELPTPVGFKAAKIDVSNPIATTVLQNYLKFLGIDTAKDNKSLLITDKPLFSTWNSYKRVIFLKGQQNEKSILPEDAKNALTLRKPVRIHYLINVLKTHVQEIRLNQGVKNTIPQPISVLLVEDNPIIQVLLKKQLKRRGIELIECASNGLEAVEKVEKSEQPFGMLNQQSADHY